MVPPVQYGGDEVSAIVLDVGSYTTRAGYAGEDCPKVVFPTSYASVPSDTPGAEPSYHHGLSSLLYRPNSAIHSPLTDGIITDYAAFSRTLQHAFTDRMRLPSLADYPLLVTEPSWVTKEQKEKMCEIAFEEWDAPAYYGVDKNVMSSFAAGKGSALVVDVGHEMASVVPIFDGFVLRKAIQKQPTAGALLSNVLLSTLKKSTPPVSIVPHYLIKSKEAVEPNSPAKAVLRSDRLPNADDPNCPTTPSFHAAQELRVMHEFKETACEVFEKPWDDAATAARPSRPFEFPDGYNSYYGTVRMAVPEILFNPGRFLPKEFAISSPSGSLPSGHPSHPLTQPVRLSQLISNALVQLDPDLHATLLSNVVLTGGTTLLPGFVDRLQGELAAFSGGMKCKIWAAAGAQERMGGSWLGGSILASLGTFHQLWIGKDEYKEVGVSRLIKK